MLFRSAPVVRSGGSLTVTAVSVTTSGPRSDLSGAVSLVMGSSTITGDLSGRLSLAAADEAGRQRLDGVLTITSGSGRIEIRVTGFATPRAGSPAVLDLTGLFRSSGSDALLTSGSMRGSLGSSLTLTFLA